MFCADERQRDMWIGMLMALALVPPDVYERDPSLREMIDIVPYGVPSKPLAPEGPVMKGVIPGIAKTDRLLLWNGGITEWNDPFTLLQAMDRIGATHDDVKLVFMGINHPDYVFGPEGGVTKRALDMAKDLGLYNRSVFFLEGWVPYERIDDYLAEADASVCRATRMWKAVSPSARATSTSFGPACRFSVPRGMCWPTALPMTRWVLPCLSVTWRQWLRASTVC